VQLATTTAKPASWDDHLRLHIAIRDLLVLSAWQPCGFSRLEVNREDDPERVMSGERIGPRWAPAVTHRLPRHIDRKRRPKFLFTFGDIGVAGVRRWLRIRTHFARALQPLIGIADQQDPFLEPRMVQSGIALEALGYQLEIDHGGIRINARGQVAYGDALQAILDDMPYVPLNDAKDWKSRSRDCYMSVKHPDNPTPDSLVLVNTLRENLLILRFWLAARLGCSQKLLRQRLDSDPLGQQYVLTT
jgi:hypothetical protein